MANSNSGQDMSNEYDKFRENLKSIIGEEIEQYIQQNNMYKTYSGTIIDANTVDSTKQVGSPYAQRCGVDLTFTQVKNLLNKTGELLKEGDSVVVFEKAGSNFSNCFIAYKNA